MRLLKTQIDVLKVLARGGHIEENRSPIPSVRLAFSGIPAGQKIQISTFRFFKKWGLIVNDFANKWKISEAGSAAFKQNSEPVLSVQEKTAKLMRKHSHPVYLDDMFRRPQ
jgi:uncharacterized protein YjhX (UPF0386 family)